MQTGVVKFFNGDKNFGFIVGEDGIDYFVHDSDILDDSIWPEMGSKCQFEVGESTKGPKAINVKVIS